MLRLLLTLLLGAWARQVAAVLALGIAIAVAAWVEGRGPGVVDLLRTAAPAAALLGTAWTLAVWRHEGGDVALAALGGRGALVWLTLTLSALPAAAVGGTRPGVDAARVSGWLASGAESGVTFTRSRPGGQPDGRAERRVTLTCDSSGARRVDDADEASRFPGFPCPTGDWIISRQRPRWFDSASRLALVGALLWALAMLQRPPGLAATLIGVIAALLVSHGLSGQP